MQHVIPLFNNQFFGRVPQCKLVELSLNVCLVGESQTLDHLLYYVLDAHGISVSCVYPGYTLQEVLHCQ